MSIWKEPLTAKPEETSHASAEKFQRVLFEFISTARTPPGGTQQPLTAIRDEVLREAVTQGLLTPLTLWLVDDYNTTVGFVVRVQHPDMNRIMVYVERLDQATSQPVYERGVMVLPPEPKV